MSDVRVFGPSYHIVREVCINLDINPDRHGRSVLNGMNLKVPYDTVIVAAYVDDWPWYACMQLMGWIDKGMTVLTVEEARELFKQAQ